MKRAAVIAGVMLVGFSALIGFHQQAQAAKTGEALFQEHCAMCHPDGGNIINPKKTLTKKDLTANKVTSAADIVKTMRNPGPGMTAFDEKTLPSAEALEVANYILKTFNK